MTDKIMGVLEIDHERGVVYFHASNARNMKRFGVQTILRICRLGVIPKDKPLDITHMFGTNFGEIGTTSTDNDMLGSPEIPIEWYYEWKCTRCGDIVGTDNPEGTKCQCSAADTNWMRANLDIMESRYQSGNRNLVRRF